MVAKVGLAKISDSIGKTTMRLVRQVDKNEQEGAPQ